MELHEQNTQWFNKYKDSLQGNIIKSNARNFSGLIFFQLSENRKMNVRQFFAFLAQRRITSAAMQKSDSGEWKTSGGYGPLFLGLYLSPLGYQYFEKEFPVSLPEKSEEASPIAVLEDGTYRQPIHGMFLLAHNSVEVVDNEVKYFKEKVVKDFEGKIVAVERGEAQRSKFDDAGKGTFRVEHFGFADGISEPVFFHKPDNSDYDLLCDIQKFVTKEPDTKKYGSYLVFMKLEQDLKNFRRWEDSFAAILENIQPGLGKKAGALMIGRDRKGGPLVNPQLNLPENWNLFNYKKDAKAEKCPFHAHVRKMNDRNGKAKENITILRRGIPYDELGKAPYHLSDSQDLPEHGAGLLFLSFQKDGKTFDEQLALANGGARPGLDPVLFNMGSNYPDDETRQQIFLHTFPGVKQGDIPLEFKGFGGFIRQRTRQDMFAPSLDFLKSLVSTV